MTFIFKVDNEHFENDQLVAQYRNVHAFRWIDQVSVLRKFQIYFMTMKRGTQWIIVIPSLHNIANKVCAIRRFSTES